MSMSDRDDKVPDVFVHAPEVFADVNAPHCPCGPVLTAVGWMHNGRLGRVEELSFGVNE